MEIVGDDFGYVGKVWLEVMGELLREEGIGVVEIVYFFGIVDMVFFDVGFDLLVIL